MESNGTVDFKYVFIEAISTDSLIAEQCCVKFQWLC